MHWEKLSPPVQTRSRPYQGVRVRDPVKELLRKKRSQELHSTKTAPPSAVRQPGHGALYQEDVVPHSNQSSYTHGVFGSEGPSGSSAELSDGGLQCAGWKARPKAGMAVPLWSEYNQQDAPAQTVAYSSASALTADVYMQTLCPSYTMLTYTHTPLLTNFGSIPVAPVPASLPQMDLQDSGLTYLPWAQPLTTISAVPGPGVQYAPGPAALPGSPLVHMPLSMSLTAMIPQLEAQAVESQIQILDLQQRSEQQLNPQPEAQPGVKAPEVELEPLNPLEKLLEDHKDEGSTEDKNSYSSSIFMRNI
ncbi:POU domain class 2-associating factor 1 [Genypterus blacodes]|uniref:POU domain class 2-associating factor 1 n=1 Tax=Genypterus blacodes TaxID=154954 RepID=UPI003F76B27D